MSSSPVSAHVVVRGRVQGVWYRASTAEEAGRLGLSGWVCNRADGSVEAVAEGPRAKVEALVAWCAKGPRLARVDAVEATWGPATAVFDGFIVRR